MSANPYTGQVEIAIGGKVCTMVFDWMALSKIHTECGANAARNMFNATQVWQTPPEHLAHMVHAGLRANHGELTFDDVMRGLPPVAKVVEALTNGLLVAYFGNDAPQSGESQPSEDSKKN